MKISKHFTEEELKCNCGCGYSIRRDKLLYDLEFARSIPGIPFNITSWSRCPIYNEQVGGSKTSSHVKGWAVDISAANETHKFILVHALMSAGFTRIGIGEDFIHVDCDPLKPSFALWFY